MKTTVRHNLIIFHFPYDWYTVAQQLREEYGPSIILIRERCRRELGFTTRHHNGTVHLDFYNPAQQTFFVLKYLNR